MTRGRKAAARFAGEGARTTKPRAVSKQPTLRWDQRTIPQSVNGGWVQYLLTRRANEETLWWPRMNKSREPVVRSSGNRKAGP